MCHAELVSASHLRRGVQTLKLVQGDKNIKVFVCQSLVKNKRAWNMKFSSNRKL